MSTNNVPNDLPALCLTDPKSLWSGLWKNPFCQCSHSFKCHVFYEHLCVLFGPFPTFISRPCKSLDITLAASPPVCDHGRPRLPFVSTTKTAVSIYYCLFNKLVTVCGIWCSIAGFMEGICSIFVGIRAERYVKHERRLRSYWTVSSILERTRLKTVTNNVKNPTNRRMLKWQLFPLIWISASQLLGLSIKGQTTKDIAD